VRGPLLADPLAPHHPARQGEHRRRQAADLTEHRDHLSTISEILVKRETIEADQFEALLEGRTEEDVFGTEAPKDVEPPSTPPTPERPGREAPRPLPRPGLAGAESRGLDLPEKPELA